jgi:uncharacterized protein DUF2631
VAGNEPVTAPDQHKPSNPRLARLGAVVSVLLLVAMALFGNHRGRVEDVWLLGTAALIVVAMVADWVLRRNGLRS